VNGSVLVNSSNVDSTSSSNEGLAVIIDEADVDAPADDTLLTYAGINMITGLYAGVHAIVPAAYISNNFDISYGLGTLTILQRPLLIKADSIQSTYGAQTTFNTTVQGLQYQDSLQSISTGSISTTVLNGSGVNVQPIYAAGSYTVVPGGISLTQPSDYIIQPVNGNLIVQPAVLTVTADLKFIYRNDPLPAFTSTITGFVAAGQNTIVSGPTYSLSPTNCCTQAGVYTITPANLVLSVPGNYSITYVSAPLYVNPKGQGAKKVDVSLICVDTIANDPSGFIYRARFQWINPNNTPVYIPLGPDNFFSALGSYVGTPPVLFPPGTGLFEVPFDGQKLTWTLKSFNGNQKTSVASDASSTSNKCSAHLNREIATNQEQVDGLLVYPNPTAGTIRIETKSQRELPFTVRLLDLTGRAMLPQEQFQPETQSLTMDLQVLPSGVYLLMQEENGVVLSVERIVRY
jgi:hypothetical protein